MTGASAHPQQIHMPTQHAASIQWIEIAIILLEQKKRSD
jgi:hypothetical protein